MAWSTDLDEVMVNGVSVKPLAGVSTDGYGTEVYGTASTYPALVRLGQEEVVTFNGDMEVSTHVAWIKSASTFAQTAQFTLSPGGTAFLLQLRTWYDEGGGVHHSKAWFKGA